MRTGRPPGTPKTGGRVKGSPASAIPATIKQKLGELAAKYITSRNLKGFEQDLDAMRPVDRAAAYEKILKYVLPTIGSAQPINGDGEPLQVVVTYQKSKPKTDEDFSDIDYSEADDLPDEDDDELPNF